MRKHLFYKVTNPVTRTTVHDNLNKLDMKKPWSVEVKPWQDKRTNAQNRYLNGVVYKVFAAGLMELGKGPVDRE